MRIFIDEGHGGHDPGGISSGAHRVEEEDIVLLYGEELDGLLRAAGHATQRTRSTDVYKSLTARAQLANAWKADLFISLHCNTSRSVLAEGAWVIHARPSLKGATLARAIFERMRKVPGVEDKDPEAEVYPDDSPWVGGKKLTVLRKSNMPAVLIELGFLTNLEDLVELQDPRIMRAICMAILRGIEDYSGVIPYVPAVRPSVSTAPHPATLNVKLMSIEEIEAAPVMRVIRDKDETVEGLLDRLFDPEIKVIGKELVLEALRKLGAKPVIIKLVEAFL